MVPSDNGCKFLSRGRVKSCPTEDSTLRHSLRLFRKTSSAQSAKTFSTYRWKIHRHQAASTLAVGIVGGTGLLLQIHARFVFILWPLDELQPPSRYFRSVLPSLELRCDNMENGCTAVVKLSELKKHMDICPYVTGHAHPPRVQQTVSAVDQAPELTLSDVISRSNLPLNRLEDIAFGVMFRRKSAEFGNSCRRASAHWCKTRKYLRNTHGFSGQQHCQ